MSKKFNKVYIELSDICGLNCSFCPSEKNIRGKMPLSLFSHILDEIQKLTDTITFHILGDPLLISNLEDYIKLAKNYKIELVTSGFYFENHSFETLLSQNISQINISLTSFNDNSKIPLDSYMKNILLFCEYAQKSETMPYINLRIWNDTSSNVIEYIENYFAIKISQDTQRTRLSKKIILDKGELFLWPNITNKMSKNGYCLGLSSHFGILSNGIVVPCCLDSDGIINLGNINEESIDDILNSDLAKNIIKNFQKNIAYHPLCQKCTYKNRFDKL